MLPIGLKISSIGGVVSNIEVYTRQSTPVSYLKPAIDKKINKIITGNTMALLLSKFKISNVANKIIIKYIVKYNIYSSKF